MDIDIADNTAFIDDEDGALRISLGLTKDTIQAGYLTMRPKITHQRVIYPSQGFCPCLQAGNMIDAYAQDLGIQSREFTGVGFIRRDLACSYGCPRLWEKHKHDIFTEIITQLDILIQMRRKRKIWCCLTDIKFHSCLL
jgi:hypothetical protein